MAPPKKRGRPPKTTTTRRSPSPPFLPVFSRPKACPKVPSRRHIEDLDDDDDPAGAFFDFSPAVNAGGAVPIPATAGPSSKAAGKSRAVQMAESGVAPCPLADIDFFTGPASGPESEDEMMAEPSNAGPSGLHSKPEGPSADVGGPSAVSTAGASVEKLFAAGVGDDADDELEESEPSLEDVDQQGQLLRARLQVTLDDLDKYLSLVQHYRKSRKYKAS